MGKRVFASGFLRGELNKHNILKPSFLLTKVKEMKHNVKITTLLLGMFLVAQIIGLIVIHAYTPQINPETGINENSLPFGMQPPEDIDYTCPTINSFGNFLICIGKLIPIIIAFAIAITLILILSKYRWKFLIKAWFFIVVIIALSLAFNAFLKYTIPTSALIALVIAIPLAFIKVYRPHFIVHNITELFVYPGISAVFVPILNIWTIIILLILISLYDMWAVWKSGIMQKMAKFHINELQIFPGLFIPTASKKTKEKIKALKLKYKNKIPPSVAKKQKFKVTLAILGGGDVVFPIITAGVFLRVLGLVPALFVTAGAFAGLTYLFINSEKKAYPAMPFITAGIFAGIVVAWLVGVF